jgi:glycosyltransferase involved in cell wall biosynthesis
VVRAWGERHPTVELLGLVPREQVQGLLGRSLAGVVTSKSEETFGLVAVEAMACGVAPIAPRMGPFPELITDQVDGVLFDAGDAGALARAFAEVDREPSRFISMGRAGRQTYRRRFGPDDNVERLLEIYRYAVAHPIEGGARATSTVA